MKKKIRIKSLPKAQFAGEPPIVLTPQQQDIWKANQNMFGFYGDVTKGSTNTTPSSTQGMVPFSTENPVMTKPFDSASVFGAPNFSMSRVAPSVTPLVDDVDMFNEPYGPLTSSNYYANVAEQYTASPEGTVFTEDAAYAPGYAPVSNSDKSLGDLSKQPTKRKTSKINPEKRFISILVYIGLNWIRLNASVSQVPGFYL
jgi:hypothetical protein